MKRIGIYPGSFDPITFGHRDIIRRSLPLLDHLIIGVAKHSGKESLFNLEERVHMIENMMPSLEPEKHSVTFEVTAFDTLLVDFAEQHNATFIIRGLRAVSDFEYEFQMASMNGCLKPDIETVFLMAHEKSQFISSTLVKEVVRLGGDASPFVSEDVDNQLKRKYRR